MSLWAILYRPETGFQCPIAQWLRAEIETIGFDLQL
jgi:hypothetical protein